MAFSILLGGYTGKTRCSEKPQSSRLHPYIFGKIKRPLKFCEMRQKFRLRV